MRQGTCQTIKEIPQAVRDTFVVSGDISAEEHVLMQGALQAFVDNSLSKTVNFPETATEEDVAKAYMLAWELNCKGITVYVTGSREKVVLETNATAEKKVPSAQSANAIEAPAQPKPEISPTIYHDTKKPRPRALTGKTYNVETPVGKAFITINENGGEHPFEAFINTAKTGSETAAASLPSGGSSPNPALASPISHRADVLGTCGSLASAARSSADRMSSRPMASGPRHVPRKPGAVCDGDKRSS
jgi:ribonucleoside-diphosphate reductase alpha chain